MERAEVTTTTPSGDELPGRGESIFLVAFFTLLMVVGSGGNCLTLAVYCPKPRKSSTHVLIVGLSLADLAVCLLRPYEIAWYASALDGLPAARLVYDGFNCLDRTFIAVSFMATGVIALDRYDCVCRPVHRRLMTARRARGSLLAIVAASVVGNTPLYLRTGLGDGPPYLLVIIYVSVLALFLASLATIAVCYGKVFLTIRRHVRTSPELYGMRQVGSTTQGTTVVEASLSDKLPSGMALAPAPDVPPVRRSSVCPGVRPGRWAKAQGGGTGATGDKREVTPGRRRRVPAPVLQRRTTTMLFVTSVVFLVVWLPWGTNALLDAFGDRSLFMKVLSNVLYVNNAINPFIYGIANRRFRKECRDVFSRMRGC